MSGQVQTPWARFRTETPGSFMMGLNGAKLRVAIGILGQGGVVSEGSLTTGRITLKTMKGGGGVPSVPRFILRPECWTGGGMPEICLHPLALPHIFVVEQIPTGESMAILGRDDTVRRVASRIVDRVPADTVELRYYLGDLLGVRRFSITLRTDYNFEVRRARR